MPAPTRPTARRRYAQEDVEKALEAIKKDLMSVGVAAVSFGVPKSTLHDKLRGKYGNNTKMGRPSVLSSAEEDLIVQWVTEVCKAGFPISKDQLIDSVARLTRDLKRENPFTNGIPGEKWFSLFLKRHPTIAQRVAQGLTTTRANVSEADIRGWFARVKTYLEEKGVMDAFLDKKRIFNADETAFFLTPKGKSVLAKKGAKTVYSVSGNDEKECVTVLVNGNAAGQLAPTMVVYSYERIPAAIAQTFPDDWAISKSETGWMTSATFFEYVTNVFYPWLVRENVTFPVVLFIDGHSSHLSLSLSDFWSEKGIEVVALYPNSTHLLQPMDVAVFRPLKAAWKKGVEKWRFENNGRKMRKDEFAPVLKTVMASLKPSTIESGFHATGLSDLNPDNVHFDNLLNRTPGNQPSANYLENKLASLKDHLLHLETKIGLEKVRRFLAGDVLLREEDLHAVWMEMKADVATVQDQINGRRQTTPPHEEHLAEDDVLPGLVVAEAADEEGLADIDINLLSDTFLAGIDEGLEFDVIVHTTTDNTTRTSSPLPGPSSAIDAVSPSDVLPGPSTPRQWMPEDGTTTDNATLPLSPPPGPSSAIDAVSPSDVLPGPSTPSSVISPSENNSIFVSPPNLPSPFKRCLIFPTPPGATKKKRLNYNREVMPSTVTGSNFKEYMRKKETLKLEKEKEKEKRRVEREEKKKLKEVKTAKKVRACIDISDNNDEDSNDDDSSMPVAVSASDLEELRVNSWVVVPYEVEGKQIYYPGQVKKIDGDEIAVKFLSKKGNKYAWPEEDDVDDSVPMAEIAQILSAPHVERRGFFTFKEKIIS